MRPPARCTSPRSSSNASPPSRSSSSRPRPRKAPRTSSESSRTWNPATRPSSASPTGRAAPPATSPTSWCSGFWRKPPSRPSHTSPACPTSRRGHPRHPRPICRGRGRHHPRPARRSAASDADYDRSSDAFQYAGTWSASSATSTTSGHHPRGGFGIGVAGFPEGHPETQNRMLEMDYLRPRSMPAPTTSAPSCSSTTTTSSTSATAVSWPASRSPSSPASCRSPPLPA